ncbi:hypothetical protein MPSEU_000639300 [Mayamaea pseudoterrestris]|nr:hypothetical protein MPSEU_000639300 [Mayamaea pseudoterrestris]
MTRFPLLILGAMLLLVVSGHETSKDTASSHATNKKLLCRVVTAAASMETLCIPVMDDGTESDAIVPIELPQDMMDASAERRLLNGTLYVHAEHASLYGEYELDLATNSTFTIAEYQPSNAVATTLTTTGTLSVMIVRVSSSDGYAPSASLNDLRTHILGTGTSMASQYKACSFGKLRFREARAMEITLPRQRSYYTSPADLAAASEAKVLDILNADSMTDLADKVIFCQPPDNLEWTSVAVVNGWRLNMKDTWCTSLSALMHEMGHSLGLLHSGLGSQSYGDATGFMGFSYTSTDWPLMCFNGIKNNQLGWYKNRKIDVNPFEGGVKVKLTSFADYRKATNSPVLITVGNYAIQYNRAKGFNLHTQAKADLVTITQDGSLYSNSVAGLGVGGRFVDNNYQGSGRQMIVTVCRRVYNADLDVDAMQANAPLLKTAVTRSNVSNAPVDLAGAPDAAKGCADAPFLMTVAAHANARTKCAYDSHANARTRCAYD